MKKMVLMCIFLLLISSLAAVNSPHPVIVELLDEDGESYPASEDVTFSAFICSSPDDVITQDSDDCYYPYTFSGQEDRKFIHIQCGSLIAQWQAGQYLCLEASNGTVTRSNSVLLTNDNFQTFEGTGLMADGVLPVTLSSFTATYLEEMPVLQWVTQSEQNNQGWNIYRNTEENSNNSLQVNAELISGSGTTSETTEYAFSDEYEIEEGSTYYYWLESISMNGMVDTYGPVSLQIPDNGEGQSPEIPLVYGLHSNYPNPFNPSTTISFALEQASEVELGIFNIKGQLIKNLFKGYVVENTTIYNEWDGRNESGNQIGSGIYLYQLKTQNKIYTKKLNLIK